MLCIQTDLGINYLCIKVADNLSLTYLAAKEFKKNWELMKYNLTQLKSSIAELESKIALLQDRYHEARPLVKGWLLKAKKMVSDFDTLVSKIDPAGTSVTDQSRQHFEIFAKIKYGKRLQKLTLKATEIIAEYGTFEKLVVSNIYLRAVDVPFSEPNHLVKKDAMIEALKASLRLENLNVIGLYGVAGIGKTTILNRLLKELERDTLGFKVVIKVQVQVLASESIDLSNIVDEIAYRVLRHDDHWKTESLDEKVRLVFAALSVKKFLLLLDGVPARIDLNTIGVPAPSAKNGSKVLFTCREQNVCGPMQAQKKFEVLPLSPDDAWNLFSKYVAPDLCEQSKLDDPEIRKLAIEVCAQCHGVPEKIVSTSMHMATAKTLAEWQRCLETFKNRSSFVQAAAVNDEENLELFVGNENPSKKLFLGTGSNTVKPNMVRSNTTLF